MFRLISAVETELFRKACDCSRTTVNVTGRTEDDLRPVMPYLNALYPKAVYDFDAELLHFSFEGRLATVRKHALALHGLDSSDEALQAIKRLKVHLNEVWQQRNEIGPEFCERPGLKSLDVYQFLPLTNCRACGEATCFSFAGKLAAFELDPCDCEPLWRDALYAAKWQALCKLVEEAL